MFKPVHSVSKRLQKLRRFPALVRRRDAVFLLDPGNWVDNRILAGAPFEHRQIARVLELIETHKIDHALDIGANFGLYSILLGKLSGIKAGHAFEPVRRNYAQLMGNIFANRLSGKIEAHRLALGAAPGTATIHIDPNSTGVSRLDLSTTDRDARVFTASETITIARLDDTLSLEGVRCFVKIDVEGHAAEVLSGMQRFLSDNAVVLQVEISESEAPPARAVLAALGYVETGAIDADVYFAKR